MTGYECGFCKTMFKIFSKFRAIDGAQTLDLNGNTLSMSKLTSYSSGRAMLAALGMSEACSCGTSDDGPYSEQFTLKDGSGNVLSDTYYTVRLPEGELIHGTTDSKGKTFRYQTDGAQCIRVYLGHCESV
ncbi:conserved hypothetical protein [Paraburkholderia unamae]|uniref:hypothetical protein n=1 Tax=Paraburkholderia unamae TaxID=219649 RepID=UPI001CB0A6C9|nr:hypothetical protein [Paraburkholderia unamae]CAG9265127.1 conserved hypothetical protein [Paraburkholderia unamae]